MRLIDADNLKQRAQKVATEAWKMNLTARVEIILNQFIDWIDEADTVEPEPKTGKWKVYEVANVDGEPPIAWQCPNCEEVVETLWKYCPECGLEMEGQE